MTKIEPKISIIFPMYNGEKFLQKNLNSIHLLENIKEIEVIIIDNNSDDASIDIVNQYKEKITLNLIRKTKNLGFAKACNIGASNAKGEFIFITNQDMIFPPTTFSKLLKIYTDFNNQDKDIVFSPAILFETNKIHYFGAVINFLGFSYTKDGGISLPKIDVIKKTQRLSGGSLFIKKDLFIKKGGFDPILFMYCEDTDLSFRLLREGINIYTTSNPYIIHQKHEMSLKDHQYFFLERNRYIVYLKNIENGRKLIPIFITLEFILLLQSLLIKKLKLKLNIYYQLIVNRKFLKTLRFRSKADAPLLKYQQFQRELDPILLGTLGDSKAFKSFLKLYNRILKLI